MFLSGNNQPDVYSSQIFASLRESLGQSETTVEQASTVSEVWDLATQSATPPNNLLVAVNLDYANMQSLVNDGDEVAFSPRNRRLIMATHILDEDFQPYQWLSEFSQQMPAGRDGAATSFIGTMRDYNDDATVRTMTLEHYPAMTQRYLEQLEKQAKTDWPLNDCLIVHRVGEVFPGEAIVLIGCWSAHRRAALDACNWLIEELKYKAPFWKKEQNQSGERWVESNTDGL